MGHRKKTPCTGASTTYHLKQCSVARPSVAARMGNPSPQTAAFLTIPHPREWIFCSTVLGSALSFIFKSLQEKQINKNHMLSMFEKDPLIRRCYREGPTCYGNHYRPFEASVNSSVSVTWWKKTCLCWKNTELNSKVKYNSFFQKHLQKWF